MKTHIIHLDTHDDLISIQDRMTWAKSARILLVWPRRGRVDIRPLDLTLLRRHAGALGAELGLVTRDGEMRSFAKEEGISFFSNTVAAQKKDWQGIKSVRPARRFPRIDLRAVKQGLPGQELLPFFAHPVWRLAIFLTGVLSVLVVMLVFIPSADVKITLPIQQQILTIAVSADPQAQTVQLSGIVPQHGLTLVVEGSDSALATGRITLPDQFATGQVLLMNLTEKEVQVPSGTVLLIPGKSTNTFETIDAVLVKAGKGKTASVAIRATLAGLEGNVTSGTITSLDGDWGKTLAVTNPLPISGGSDLEMPISTEQDRAQLKKRLLADLERKARARFWEQISEGDVLLPESFAFVRILDETGSPADGQTGKTISLNLRVEFSIAFAAYKDLRVLAQRVLDASLPANSAPLADPISLESFSTPAQAEASVFRWQMRVTRNIVTTINSSQVTSLVAGKPIGRADSLLRDMYDLLDAPIIQVRPGWWPWLPFLPIRIFVTG